jgi:hypothetical protein
VNAVKIDFLLNYFSVVIDFELRIGEKKIGINALKV